MKSKEIYNLNSTEDFMEAKILGGNPSGIINFCRSNHKWAISLWKIMEGYTWFSSEPNISQDKVNYPKLSPAEKRMYDLVLAQLITNDSIQTNQLMDSINQYVTSPVVNACLSRQAYEEANHSKSYAVMAEDICEDPDRIYNLHKHDEGLATKNQAVADMYALINSSDDPSHSDILKAFAANQILEELVFPGGFVAMWSIGAKMTGSASMISFIERDKHKTRYKIKSIVPLSSNV